MGKPGTVSVMFTDIVDSTALMESAGPHAWDEHRRAHFEIVRNALSAHGGTEVKNTGDGVMAVFDSVVNMVECAAAIQLAVHGVRLGGGPIAVRIGGSIGEATSEGDDWFGTPVVEAARLCALAASGETLVTGIVHTLAGSADVIFETLEPVTLKGFDRPVDVARLVRGDRFTSTAYTDLELVALHRTNVLRSLDYWGSLAAMRDMRAKTAELLRLQSGDSFCDVGCGAGDELARLAAVVGTSGRAVGVDPSEVLLDEARLRAEAAGVAVELHATDGRTTGLQDQSFDAVRIERVVQHVGDIDGFLAEAYRLVKPGGRVAIADTDWGSLMLHPGDPELVKRLKNVFENGAWAEPFAGRKLHGAMQLSGFADVVSVPFFVRAEPGLMTAVAGVIQRLIATGIAEENEMREFSVALEAGLNDGSGLWAFTSFVAVGTRPID
jgi:class 3 adenylate cyclase